MTRVFHIPAEIKLRGTIVVEAETRSEVQERIAASDLTLIDQDFFAVAEIVDWEFSDSEEQDAD